MVIPLLMASIIDEGVTAGNIDHIKTTGLWMLLLAVVSLCLGLLSARFGAQASAGLARNLRQAMFEKIQTYSFSNIDKFSTSSLITRLTTDVTNVQNAYMMILRMCSRAPASLLVAMVLSFSINAELASIYLVAVVVLGVLLFLIMSRAMKYFKQVFQKYDDMNASVQENVTGIRVVKAYVREDHENKKFQKASQNIYKTFLSAEKILSWNAPLMNFTVYACILLISWLGANMIVGSSLTTGELMNLLTYCMNILMSLMMLSMVFVMITMSTASAERICEVLKEEPDLVNPEHPVHTIADGSVEFRHVDFAYRKNADKPVLKDINLSVRSGETIGIIGGTGSAKTSLVQSHQPAVRRHRRAACWWADGTCGNTTWSPSGTRSPWCSRKTSSSPAPFWRICAGATRTPLWRNANGPAGWPAPMSSSKRCPRAMTPIMEQGGTNVSGGQRQRLCIARALLKKPKVLILDDSTSAVDTATDARIRQAFAREIPDTTKFIIAQRVSSVSGADRILVLDDGVISGFDTHENLLKTNPIYQDVYESQTSGNGDFDEGSDH